MLHLKTCNRGGSAQFRSGDGPRRPPGGKVGKTRIKDLAGPDEIVEAAHDFFYRRDSVRHVGPIEIDAIGFEPPEARLDRGDHGLAAIAGDENTGRRVRPHGELGGQHEIVAPPSKQIAQDFLRLTELIAVGCIDEVAAGVRIGVEDTTGLLGLRAMPPACPEATGPEHQFGDPKSRVLPEKFVTHACFSISCDRNQKAMPGIYLTFMATATKKFVILVLESGNACFEGKSCGEPARSVAGGEQAVS
ncbi:hypothetical protein MPLA_1100006 [Mesorhizobium sp. ORS 3359]|nr:hypothetical protein MPLA_1100006 [Mesorhizobium sp. ORS 3359]